MDVKKIIYRYRYFFIFSICVILIYNFNNAIGNNIVDGFKSSFFQMLSVLPPILVLIGLLDVWVSKEYFIKYMGEKSGALGVFLSIFIAAIGAGPMYASFPFTGVLLKKGVKFSNIIIFMNAWCVIKISTLLFEVSALGYEFTMLRLIINIPGVILMGYIVEYFLNLNLNKKRP